MECVVVLFLEAIFLDSYNKINEFPLEELSKLDNRIIDGLILLLIVSYNTLDILMKFGQVWMICYIQIGNQKKILFFFMVIKNYINVRLSNSW